MRVLAVSWDQDTPKTAALPPVREGSRSVTRPSPAAVSPAHNAIFRRLENTNPVGLMQLMRDVPAHERGRAGQNLLAAGMSKLPPESSGPLGNRPTQLRADAQLLANARAEELRGTVSPPVGAKATRYTHAGEGVLTSPADMGKVNLSREDVARHEQTIQAQDAARQAGREDAVRSAVEGSADRMARGADRAGKLLSAAHDGAGRMAYYAGGRIAHGASRAGETLSAAHDGAGRMAYRAGQGLRDRLTDYGNTLRAGTRMAGDSALNAVVAADDAVRKVPQHLANGYRKVQDWSHGGSEWRSGIPAGLLLGGGALAAGKALYDRWTDPDERYQEEQRRLRATAQ